MEKIGKVWAFIFVIMIRLYRLLLSPVLGPCCRFYPSCSVYAIEALQQKGFLHGTALFLKRILKCHPWHGGGYDPIP